MKIQRRCLVFFCCFGSGNGLGPGGLGPGAWDSWDPKESTAEMPWIQRGEPSFTTADVSQWNHTWMDDIRSPLPRTATVIYNDYIMCNIYMYIL